MKSRCPHKTGVKRVPPIAAIPLPLALALVTLAVSYAAQTADSSAAPGTSSLEPIHALVVAPSTSSTSSTLSTPSTSSTPSTLPARLAGLAPAGWRLYDKVKQFTPDNLYVQIDGRAEFFLAYDVAGLTFANFENAADPKQSVDVSVYDMKTPANAFGVFAAERSGGETSISIGRAAYRAGASVYVWKGRYYIQVIPLKAGDELQKPALELARKAADLLPDSGEKVWGLAALPEKNRVPDSIRYFLVDAMGLDFMRNTYTAQYRRSGGVIEVFVSQRESPESAKGAVDKYREHAAKYGKGARNETVEKHEFLVCDMGGAFDVVFQKERLVAGVTGAKDRVTALEEAASLYTQLRGN